MSAASAGGAPGAVPVLADCCPVASSVSSGFSRSTIRSLRTLCMHLVQRQLVREGVVLPLSSVISNAMGMCATLLRVIDVSNCAAIKCTNTIAPITGGITAVDKCSSCAIWSFFEVPRLPRSAMSSSNFFFTFSSLSTILGASLASLDASASSFFFPGPCTRSFFFLATFSKPSSESESEPSPVFIHLLMPLPSGAAFSSSDDEDESEGHSSESSSSSLPDSFDSFLAFSGFFFFLSSSLSLSLPLLLLSLSLSLSLSLPSFSSSSSTGFSTCFAICAS
mmetsp:Transcript_85250/g.138218  ORF Transcript_85250/g.138218 Transcript_85250/m.138218 type:complete len:279 (+) Transcript_85250:1374-2210(+)